MTINLNSYSGLVSAYDLFLSKTRTNLRGVNREDFNHIDWSALAYLIKRYLQAVHPIINPNNPQNKGVDKISLSKFIDNDIDILIGESYTQFLERIRSPFVDKSVIDEVFPTIDGVGEDSSMQINFWLQDLSEETYISFAVLPFSDFGSRDSMGMYFADINPDCFNFCSTYLKFMPQSVIRITGTPSAINFANASSRVLSYLTNERIPWAASYETYGLNLEDLAFEASKGKRMIEREERSTECILGGVNNRSKFRANFDHLKDLESRVMLGIASNILPRY